MLAPWCSDVEGNWLMVGVVRDKYLAGVFQFPITNRLSDDEEAS